MGGILKEYNTAHIWTQQGMTAKHTIDVQFIAGIVREFYVHVTVHRNKFLCNKTN